jgi:hypothetical protein
LVGEVGALPDGKADDLLEEPDGLFQAADGKGDMVDAREDHNGTSRDYPEQTDLSATAER